MYEDRVARGAQLLDEHKPGWWRQIACDRLAMESCDDCVLGQVYGHYLHGCKAILRAADAPYFSWVESGFNLRITDHVIGERSRYDVLADAWRVEISRRLDAEEASRG